MCKEILLTSPGLLEYQRASTNLSFVDKEHCICDAVDCHKHSDFDGATSGETAPSYGVTFGHQDQHEKERQQTYSF